MKQKLSLMNNFLYLNRSFIIVVKIQKHFFLVNENFFNSSISFLKIAFQLFLGLTSSKFGLNGYMQFINTFAQCLRVCLVGEKVWVSTFPPCSAGAPASNPTVFLSHIAPALASSHQPDNSVFLSHHSSSSLPNAVV